MATTTDGPGPPLLEVRKLVFEAGGTRVLDGLDLSVGEGEVHALLGANGTGKSTLAALVMGLGGYRATGGEILFRGRRIDGLGIQERAALGITLAWQEPARFEGLTVRDYLELSRRRDVRAPGPGECLSLVGLRPEAYLERCVDRSLSGGQRKRVELASVFALAPALALLDEPDSGIDMLSTDDVINVIGKLRGLGASVLLITHRQEIALAADRASQLCGGAIIESGEPCVVADHYVSRKCTACRPEVCPHGRA